MTHTIYILSICICALNISVFSQEKRDPDFLIPVNIPVLLSANFGELRPNHFHTGIDIKTQKITGKSVIAIDNGYVSRISISPYGYGRAVYITHPSGHISVYGHLTSFSPKIDAYLTRYQYKEKTHSANIFIPTHAIPVSRGEEIGKSGNSGSSGGPHVHFEIRDSANKAINPLLFYPQIDDYAFPRIQSFYLYNLDSNLIQHKTKRYRAIQKSPGNYTIPGPISTQGLIGFGIRGNDKIHNVHHIFGYHTVSLTCNDSLLYKRKTDTISFHESRDINSLLDYKAFAFHRRYIEKLYVEPNNELSIYSARNNGLLVEQSKNYHCTVKVQDYHKNTAQLDFTILCDTNSYALKIQDTIYSYAHDFSFKKEGFSFRSDSASFYKDFLFDVAIDSTHTETEFSPRYTISSSEFTLKKEAHISIQSTIPDSLRTYGIIRYVSQRNRRRTLQTAITPDGKAHTHTQKIGTYSVVIDTVSPIINRVNFKDGSNIQNKKHISFRMYDNLSGIAEYAAYIDSKWCVLYFDAKYAYVTLDLAKAPISESNTEHSLVLFAKDAVGNTTKKEYTFYW
ncbi:MAG: M23 family metallopeptidase [Bacteroidales bacterium]